jgi:prephenate dehydrogenase
MRDELAAKEIPDQRDHFVSLVLEREVSRVDKAQLGVQIAAPIRSRLTVSTSEAAVEAAVIGSGVTRVMSYKMEAARRSGALEGSVAGPHPLRGTEAYAAQTARVPRLADAAPEKPGSRRRPNEFV